MEEMEKVYPIDEGLGERIVQEEEEEIDSLNFTLPTDSLQQK